MTEKQWKQSADELFDPLTASKEMKAFFNAWKSYIPMERHAEFATSLDNLINGEIGREAY